MFGFLMSSHCQTVQNIQYSHTHTRTHTRSGQSTQLIRITSCMEHTWTWTRQLSHPAATAAAVASCCCCLQLPHAASSAWATASSSRTSANDLINHRVRQRNIPWFCLCPNLCPSLCPGCRCCCCLTATAARTSGQNA